MSTVAGPRPSIEPRELLRDQTTTLPRLLGLGSAVPDLCWTSQQTLDTLGRLWNLRGGAIDRWRRIVEGTEIDTRYSVLPLEDVVHLSTAQRMSAYEEHAAPLAVAAAAKAMADAAVNPSQITDLIVVSCTGFSAPGLDVELIVRLDLPRNVRRTLVGFMGCFGGISGLRTAVGPCAANRDAIALVVCCELCSLHVRPEPDVQNQVASALFADGAAAAIVASPDGTSFGKGNNGGIGRLDSGASMLLEHGREWMTWRITDAGFAMTLAREVPIALRDALADFVEHAQGDLRPRSFIIHPGGPGILDAADVALGLRGGCGLSASHSVLKRIGNVSSATVLIVLEEALRHDAQLPAMLLAFGPGLTIESMMLRT